MPAPDRDTTAMDACPPIVPARRKLGSGWHGLRRRRGHAAGSAGVRELAQPVHKLVAGAGLIILKPPDDRADAGVGTVADPQADGRAAAIIDNSFVFDQLAMNFLDVLAKVLREARSALWPQHG